MKIFFQKFSIVITHLEKTMEFYFYSLTSLENFWSMQASIILKTNCISFSS